jgi:membrane-bound ClpP family serine protease
MGINNGGKLMIKMSNVVTQELHMMINDKLSKMLPTPQIELILMSLT